MLLRPCLKTETTVEEEISDIGQILVSTCILVYTSVYMVVYSVVQMTDTFMVWTGPESQAHSFVLVLK